MSLVTFFTHHSSLASPRLLWHIQHSLEETTRSHMPTPEESTQNFNSERVQELQRRALLAAARGPTGYTPSVLPMSLLKSKQRVADHGEVFTPAWMAEAMLDLVKDETERIDSRLLEPACGSGNFLVQILRRKLAAVELKYGKSDFERRHYALLGLMCLYGIELLPDNIAECRANLLEVFAACLKLDQSEDLYRAAFFVLSQNLVHGDALTMRTHDDLPITFAEWGYLGKGKFQRRDFRFDSLTQSAAFGAEDLFFGQRGGHDIFNSTKKAYPTMTVHGLATFAQEATL
jgi:hypothetical protein